MLSGDSPRNVPQTPVLQKASSTITLQATRGQLEQRAPTMGALSPGEEMSPSSPQPAPTPTGLSDLGSPEVVSEVATRKTPVESQSHSAWPKFESEPQSQEVSEDQVVKFRCEGE